MVFVVLSEGTNGLFPGIEDFESLIQAKVIEDFQEIP
jgi:hypothetical protein